VRRSRSRCPKPVPLVLPLLAAAGLLTSAAPAAPAAATTVKVALLQGEQIVYVDRPGSTYAIPLERGSPFRPQINAALAGVIRSDALKQLRRRWLGTDTSTLPVLR
jgi:ABC-type amino acid transport substrate-binding protein